MIDKTPSGLRILDCHSLQFCWSLSTGQAHHPWTSLMDVCGVDELAAGSAPLHAPTPKSALPGSLASSTPKRASLAAPTPKRPSLAASTPKRASLAASSRPGGSCRLQQRSSLWGPCPVTGKLLSQETMGCGASQMDAAFPKQRKYSPWHPASLALSANPEEKPPCSLLTGIVMAASQLVPTALNQPILLTSSLGRCSVPLTGSRERKRA